MKKTYYLLCLFFCLTCCSDENLPEKYPVIGISNSIGHYQRVYCSDLFSSIELIPLETNENCLIGQITGFFVVLVNDSMIFIRSNAFWGSWDGIYLYVFDHSGKFLNQIGMYGRGPGEYQRLGNIFLNHDKPTIFLDNSTNILEYEFGGKYIRSIRIPDIDNRPLSQCSYVGDNIFVGQVSYHGKNDYKYCLFDQNSTITECFPSYIFFDRVKDFASSYDRALYPVRVDNRFYLKDFVNDTLYVLSNSILQPAYIFDMGKYSFPKKHLENLLLEEKTNTILFSVFPTGFVGTPEYFFYEIEVPDQLPRPKSRPEYFPFTNQYVPSDAKVRGIYNIAQNTNILLDTDKHLQKGIINDINGGLSFFPRYYAGNNVVVDVWQAEDMKEILTEEYFATQVIKDKLAYQKLREVLKKLKEDDNPVVVIAKLK